MSAVALWECSACSQTTLRPWLPCDCATPSAERLLITPYGSIPAPGQQLGLGPLEAEQVAA